MNINFYFTFLITISFMITHSYDQKIEELYKKRDFKNLIKHASSKNLTKDECYFIGYAYFQLEDDKNAIKMYDKAIRKGLTTSHIYLYKGLALRYDKQYENAIKSFNIAIQKNPKSQKNYTELGNVYYFTQRYDSALVNFYKAREQKYQIGDPYDKIPNIYHTQEKFKKALEEYRISANLIDKKDKIYVELLTNIGLLEYAVMKNYPNSIAAYSKMISLVPEKYDLYPKLIKAYYANENYVKGDSIYSIVKGKYDKAELSKDLMEAKSIMVDEFLWNGQKVSVLKYFPKPKKFAESIYKFFLLDSSGQKVVRKLMTEKTDLDIDNTKHVLCGIDKSSGIHETYPIGWDSDDIDYKELKKFVIKILNDEIESTASSKMKSKK